MKLFAEARLFSRKQKAVPVIDRVSEQDQIYKSPGQGTIKKFEFFCSGVLIGRATVEFCSEEDLVLVHDIRAQTPSQRQGTAMVAWLVDHSCGLIQPVHVICGGMPFWHKLRREWPGRISEIDLRCSEYQEWLDRRAALEIA